MNTDACSRSLLVLKAEIDAEMPSVVADYQTLARASLLMRRLGTPSIVEALREEARQRVLRRRRAALEEAP